MPKTAIPQPVIAGFPGTESTESTKERKTMTKTAATAKTATAKKESAVKSNESKKMTKAERKAAAIAARESRLAELAAKYPDAEVTPAVNVHHVWNTERTSNEKDLKPLHVSELDKLILAYECIEHGWAAPEFATEKQFALWGGVVPESVKENKEGFFLFGPTGAFPTTYYNVEQVEFPEGGPAWDEDEYERQNARNAEFKAARKAKAAEKKAAGQAKATPEPVQAMPNAAAVPTGNDALIQMLMQQNMMLMQMLANRQ